MSKKKPIGYRFTKPLNKVQKRRVESYWRSFKAGMENANQRKNFQKRLRYEKENGTCLMPWRPFTPGVGYGLGQKSTIDYIRYYVWEVRKGAKFTAVDVRNWMFNRRPHVTGSVSSFSGLIYRNKEFLAVEKVPGTEIVVWQGTTRPY